MEYTEMGTGLLIVAVVVELAFYILVYMFGRNFYKKWKVKKSKSSK